MLFSVPDIHIDGVLLAVHLMLDKRQLDIIKGIIDMNLGEDIDEFEKPSTVIHDPVSQVCGNMSVCCLAQCMHNILKLSGTVYHIYIVHVHVLVKAENYMQCNSK